MTREIWIEVMRSFVAPLIVGAVVAWVTARLTAKYSRSAENPSEKPLSKTQILIRRIGSFIKRNWADFVVTPLTFVMPVRSFINDLSAPIEDVRVFVMRVALDVLLLAIFSAFWIALYVSHLFTMNAARARRAAEAEAFGHKKEG